MRRQLRGQPEEPQAEPLGLRPPPGPGEMVLAQRVQRLVRHGGQTPQQGVAAHIVHRCPARRELGHLLDSLLDHRARVVAAPRRQGVDAADVGEHVGLAEDLVGVDRQRSVGLQGPGGLDRQQPRAPELPRRRPQVLARRHRLAFGRVPPGAPVPGQPSVTRHLEQERHAQAIERPHHPPAEEALVEAHRDVLHSRASQAPHEILDPLRRPVGRVGAASPPAHAKAVAGLPHEDQERMMRRTAPLLRVVAHLRPGLLLSVAHHHGRVDDQRQPLRGPARERPAPPDHVPQQRVEERNHALGHPPQPAPEGRGVRHPHPAEDPAHAPPVEQRQVVHHAAAVEQQDDPRLDHQRRPEEALLLPRPAIDPAAQPEPVEQLADQDQPPAVREVLRAVADTQRLSATLNSSFQAPPSSIGTKRTP